MLFRQIYDRKLSQYAYLVGCQQTKEALLIDPERDVDRYLEIAATEGLRITAVTETHIHADFLSGVRELSERHGATAYLSREGGPDWSYAWAGRGGGGGGAETAEDNGVRLIGHGDSFSIGKIEIQVLHTPGHTPEHLSFVIVDRGGGASEPIGIASGDFVFVGDLGRPDLLESAAGEAGAMEPSARNLYRSVQDFLNLPDFLQLWPGHGAGSACGKALGAVPMSTVGYEKRFNASINAASKGEDSFVGSILEGQPEPPLYFARMKTLNREGPPILGALPRPRRLDARELSDAARSAGTVVLDTRLDRRAFMAGHLSGTLYAPFDKSFPTIAGSYIEPTKEIVLLIDQPDLESAVRDLVRIGLDRIVGFAPPATLEQASDLVTTSVIDFAAVEELRQSANCAILDCRGASEYATQGIPDSINIAHTRLLDRLDELPVDRELLVHCASGARASAASALLERQGFAVRLIDDLFSRWQPASET